MIVDLESTLHKTPRLIVEGCLVVAIFGISLLLFGGVQAFGQEWSAEQKEVWKMEVAYWDLLKEGNLNAYLD
jgi:hypothetical protein